MNSQWKLKVLRESNEERLRRLLHIIYLESQNIKNL